MKKILILDFDGTIIDSNFVKQNSIIEYIKDKYRVNILNYMVITLQLPYNCSINIL